MDLRLSDKQLSLQRSYAKFFAEKCTPSLIRQLEHPPGGLDDAHEQRKALQIQIWQSFSRLGGTRLTLPTKFGGLGWGLGEAIIVAEQIGRVLYQSPYFDTLTAIDVLCRARSITGTQRALLMQVASGEKHIALALREHGATDPSDLSAYQLSAVQQTGGWMLSGEKRFVACANQVHFFLVPLSLATGPALFLLPAQHPGITLRRHDEIGRGELYAITFNGVKLTENDLIGTHDEVGGIYVTALAHARVRQAAYLVGLCQKVLEITLQYTQKRQQFGQSIASFQSIAFRLASFATQIDAAYLLTHQAAWQADQQQDVRRAACEVLALTADLALEWTAAALQMHGSYGLTEHAEVQRYYRRAAVDTLVLGTPAQLRHEAITYLSLEVADTPALQEVAIS